jgi:hypothetical protein
MKVVAYLNCLPPNNKNIEKGEILPRYAAGVRRSDDETVLHSSNDLIPADVALLVGWVHEDSKFSSHLNLRRSVIEFQKQQGKHTVLADSNLFLYKNKENPGHYLRYSFNGVFPNTGNYCDTIIDPSRWTKLSNELNVGLKDYRSNGNHVLLCLQRNGGWSMGGHNVMDWAASTITKLRQYTDREIVVRGHPGDKGTKDYLHPKTFMKRVGYLKNIRLSDEGVDLMHDLQDCWAVVNHNSSPTVGAAIEGYPIFVTDPYRSQCADIANVNLEDIEVPRLPERQDWANRLAMFHWNFEEVASGECWRHMRQFIQ